MKVKSFWCYLFFALLSVNISAGVAAGIEGGQKRFKEVESNKGQENDVEKVITHKLESIRKIMLEFQDNQATKLDTLSSPEYDLSLKVKDFSDKILLEQTKNTKQINENIDSVCKNKNVHESSEKMNLRLAAIENTLQRLESNINRELNDSVDKINLHFTNTVKGNQNTESDQQEILTLKSLENKINKILSAINDLANNIVEKFDKLENNNNKGIIELENKINLLISPTKELNEKVDETNKQKTILELIEITNNGTDIPQTTNFEERDENLFVSEVTSTSQPLEVTEIDTSESENKSDTFTSSCDLKVPTSVKPDSSIWKKDEIPAEDDLDRFMNNKTDCKYKALKHDERVRLPDVVFDGELFEWRGAIRARDEARISVWWGKAPGYYFYIGQDYNVNTRMYQWGPFKELWVQPTTDILSETYYVPFYIKIRNGTLTFGKECEKPLFTHVVKINLHAIVRMEFQSYSHYGGKFIYNCTGNVGDRKAN